MKAANEPANKSLINANMTMIYYLVTLKNSIVEKSSS